MAIPLGIHPIFRQTHMAEKCSNHPKWQTALTRRDQIHQSGPADQGPGITSRSGHLWWMIGNAHENRNAHLVMVQTWAPKKKMRIPTWQNKRNIGQHRMVNTTKSAGSYSNFRIHPVVTPFHWAANGGHAKEAQRQPPMWPAGHGTCNCRRHLHFASYITTAPFFGNIYEHIMFGCMLDIMLLDLALV